MHQLTAGLQLLTGRRPGLIGHRHADQPRLPATRPGDANELISESTNFVPPVRCRRRQNPGALIANAAPYLLATAS